MNDARGRPSRLVAQQKRRYSRRGSDLAAGDVDLARKRRSQGGCSQKPPRVVFFCAKAPLVRPSPPHSIHSTQHDNTMAATCDVSFDEMAIALSYISLGGAAAAPASSARGLPSLAPVKKEKKEKKAAAADDDVSSEPRKTNHRGSLFSKRLVHQVYQVYYWLMWCSRGQNSRHPCTVNFGDPFFVTQETTPPLVVPRRRFRPVFTFLATSPETNTFLALAGCFPT